MVHCSGWEKFSFFYNFFLVYFAEKVFYLTSAPKHQEQCSTAPTKQGCHGGLEVVKHYKVKQLVTMWTDLLTSKTVSDYANIWFLRQWAYQFLRSMFRLRNNPSISKQFQLPRLLTWLDGRAFLLLRCPHQWIRTARHKPHSFVTESFGLTKFERKNGHKSGHESGWICARF